MPNRVARVLTDRSAERSGVPFFSGRQSFVDAWPEIERHANEVIDRGKYSHGRKVAELEAAMREATGSGHAVAVNSGTDALVLLLRAAGLERGDEVIVPCFTFIASASAVVHAGGRPVFVDIEDGDYGIDVDQLDSVLTSRTRAIMPVHLFHGLAELGTAGNFAAKHDLAIVEDSAEAIGMEWDGRHAGRFGAGGVLSFFPSKTLGAIGDAGMVLTDDERIAEEVSVLRHHGRLGKTIDHIAGISNLSGVSGTNSKMDDLQAAVLLARLPYLQRDIEIRQSLAERYRSRVEGRPGVLEVPTPRVRTAPTRGVFYSYVAQFDDRDRLVRHLSEAGIETECYYPRPLHLQPCFEYLGYRSGQFPRAEAACTKTLALPLYPDLSTGDLDRVCESIGKFYGWRP